MIEEPSKGAMIAAAILVPLASGAIVYVLAWVARHLCNIS